MNLLRMLMLAVVAQIGAIQQQGTASVQGTVVKVVTNEPISKAAVELRSLEIGPARAYTSTTEGDGKFAFRNLPPGRYQLTAIRGGYVRGDYGLRGPGASGVTITLAPGQRMPDVRLAMRGTGTIAGRITDLEGEGVGNVHVKALRFSYQDGHIALIDVKSVFTNDLGEYRLGWLPPGLYNVSALHPDATVSPLNLPEIINSATIVGTVVTNAGGMNGGSFNASGNPDPAVRSRLGLAPGEDYAPIYFPGTSDQRSATVIDVRAGAELGGFDIAMAPIRLGSITGDVIDGTGRAPLSPGLPSLSVAVRSPMRPQVHVSRNPSYNYGTSSVGIDAGTGSFSIAGVAPGSYVVAAAFGNGDNRVTGLAIVDVTEGAAAHARVALEQGLRVLGGVVVEGRPSSSTLANLRVSLRTDPVIPGIADTPSATPAADGTLTLTGVVPGDYFVNVVPLMTLSRAAPPNPPPAVPGPPAAFGPTGPAVAFGPNGPISAPAASATGSTGLQGAYVKSIRFGDADVLNGGLRLDVRSLDKRLEIVVGTNPGQLDGVAVDDKRRPVANVTVVLIPEKDRRHRIDLYKMASTDAAGRFRFQNIPPDDYKVLAWDDVETGAWLDPRFIRIYEDRGSSLRIGEGAKVAAEVPVISLR